MGEVVLITGASSGFGKLSATALADAGHIVYASMRNIAGEGAVTAAANAEYANTHGVDLHSIQLDVSHQDSADAAIARLIGEQRRLDVVVHNAGHMMFGPAEAFTPEQLASAYDINVVGTQRVNRAALPHLRAQGRGLLLWVSSSSVAGGTPPYLAPYFAAKAGMDALAVSYARELTRWGIETSILVPGAFTKGTNHFANAGQSGDAERAAAYDAGPYEGFADEVQKAFASIVPESADVADVARALVAIVGAPFGTRPFRVYVDPTHDGAEVSFPVLDRLREEMLHRVGLADLLAPRKSV